MKGWKVAYIYNNIDIYARPLCSSKHDAFKEKRGGERETRNVVININAAMVRHKKVTDQLRSIAGVLMSR